MQLAQRTWQMGLSLLSLLKKQLALETVSSLLVLQLWGALREDLYLEVLQESGLTWELLQLESMAPPF